MERRLAALWEKRFSELVRFKAEHGHCNVPRRWSENPELGRWVAKQQAVYRRGELSPDRVERLEALGFEWDPSSASWEKRFSELVRFKEEHGHCDVLATWSENPKLGNWVHTQRRAAKNGQLIEERRRRLEEIGFRF